MPPHGPGLLGSNHSHDSRYPDDTWNLYSMLEIDSVRGLNVSRPQDTIGIFKPHALKLQEDPHIASDADAEIIVIAKFTSPVSIRKIMVIGAGSENCHPALLKCYVNSDLIDFNNIEDFIPAQTFNLPANSSGTIELTTSLQPFTNIQTIAFYFPANHGEIDVTMIKYIGLQGEHTHYRREAVDTVYEVLCNGQDIVQPEDASGQLGHERHMH
jgi:hypothetical protein